MALIGPRITGDADITGIARSIRNEGLLVEKTGNFTIDPKEAEIFRILSGTITATLPAASSTSLQVGSTFLFVNDSSGILTVHTSTGTTVGTVPSGETGMVILATNADATGVWKLIVLNQAMTGVTKFSMTFNADISPTAGASWGAATGDAHAITFDPSSLVSANPMTLVFDDVDNQQVLIKTVSNSNSDVEISVPAISGATFAGRVVII